MKVKVCGLTRAEDVGAAIEEGVDFVGFVLAPSRRQVSLARAQELLCFVRPPTQAVAVLVDADWDLLVAVAAQGFRLVQCHGKIPPRLPEGLGGIWAQSGAAWDGSLRLRDPWIAWLLDGPNSGSGQPFDWCRLSPRPRERFLVAGGLGPENVGDVIRTLHPYGVDVSSGVESAPGQKDRARIRQFVDAARRSE